MAVHAWALAESMVDRLFDEAPKVVTQDLEKRTLPGRVGRNDEVQKTQKIEIDKSVKIIETPQVECAVKTFFIGDCGVPQVANVEKLAAVKAPQVEKIGEELEVESVDEAPQISPPR